MGSPIENAKANWAEKLEAGPRKIVVPEWGDDKGPLEIFVYPANLRERNKIYQRAKGEDLTALADTVILRAKTGDGAAVFSPGDRSAMVSAIDPDVLARVAGEIMEDMAISEDDVAGMEKN